MDNAKIKTTSAVVVDYDYFRSTPAVQKWVKDREPFACLVAFVGSPDAEHPEDYLSANDEPEWDVVIANHSGSRDADFKRNALGALNRMSNIHPVIALDLFNHADYQNAGVLLVVTPTND